MTDLNRPDSSNLDGLTAAGSPILANRTMGVGGLLSLGCALANATTYFFPFGAQHAPVPAQTPLVTVQVRWDASFAGTITIETTIFPSTVNAQSISGPVQVSDFNADPGIWLLQNPPSAYVPIVGGGATAMTVTVAGGAAGGCEFDLGNLGPRRGRVRVASATGGVVRVGVHGKAAA